MRKFIWTWLFADGSTTSLCYWAQSWNEANANAADALARHSTARSITVELHS